MQNVYLDHAATTPPSLAAQEALVHATTVAWGNPSSHHALGREALKAVDASRDSIAHYFACKPRNVVFCSSGTEADNLALRGVLDRWSQRGRHIIVSAIEHEGILATAEALGELGVADISIVGCDHEGRVLPKDVAHLVRPDTILVSVMMVNNETGVIQDIAGIAASVKEANPTTLVHTDAVQGAGYLTCTFEALGVDLISVSSHKLYGPKGAGCLLIKDGVFLTPIIHGGGHERNRRSGTEAVPAIVGFGAAIGERNDVASKAHTVAKNRDLLISLITDALPDLIIPGSEEHRLPSCAPVLVPGIRNEQLLARLDIHGVYASGGSACAAGATQPSHVLTAMGYDTPLSKSLIRFTLGDHTTTQEIQYAATVFIEAVRAMRQLSPPQASTAS